MKFSNLLSMIVIVAVFALSSCTSSESEPDTSNILNNLRSQQVTPFQSIEERLFDRLAQAAVFDDELTFRGLTCCTKELKAELGEEGFNFAIAKLTNQIPLETSMETFLKMNR